VAIEDDKAFLGISERAVSTFDDFLLSRFHMFLTVYFHYKPVCLEKMLKRYFTSSPEEYSIPADINEYLNHDDHFLMKVLRNSDNIWAKRIVSNQIPQKVFETFGADQIDQLKELETYFESENIDFIKCSSSGRLSKYYTQGEVDKYSLKVIRESALSKETTSKNIHEATDLFDKFSNSHSVNRIHLDLEDLTKDQRSKISNIIS
jgi:HD superfamily phosphohydrolase